MGFSTCIRVQGLFTLNELDKLENFMNDLDANVKFQTSLPRCLGNSEARPKEDVEALIQFSNSILCTAVIDNIHGLPLGPEGAALELRRLDGKLLDPNSVPQLHARMISPLPPGTSKAILLDAVKRYGADSTVGIFYNIGGLVRFTTAEGAKAAEDAAAAKKLLILDTPVTMRAVDETRVFCTELSPRVTEQDLLGLFEKHGIVTDVYLSPEKKIRGRLSRYAVISFNTGVSAAAALRANNGNVFYDRLLRLFFCDANWGSNMGKAHADAKAAPLSSSNVAPADVTELESAFVAEIQTRLAWRRKAGEKSSANPAEQCDADRIALKAERDGALHKLEVIESRRRMLEMDLEMWREKYRALQTRTDVELRELREEQARQHDEKTRRRDEQAREHAEKEKANKAKAEKAEKDRLAKEAKDARWRKEEQERLAKAEAEAARLAKEAEERRRMEEAEARRRRLEEEAARQKRRFAAAAAEEDRCLDAHDRYMLVSQEFDSPSKPFSDIYPVVARSVPWPVLAHPFVFNIASLTWDMVEHFTKAMKGIMTANEYRTFLKNARLRFHPDKWAARRILQAVEDDEMRAQMEVACKTVSQAINDAVREMGGC